MIKFTVQAIALSIGLAFSAGAAAERMSKAEYKSAKASIAADLKADRTACASMSDNAKDICRAEAKGKADVAKAELEQRNAPSRDKRRAVTIAKAKADYAVAKERCDDKSGRDKKACVNEAKAAMNRGMADAERPGRQPTAAAASKTQKAGDYIDDSVITAKVKAAVLGEPTLKSAEINVETHKGKVQLSGFVRSRADINKAVQVARGVEGVRSVDNVMIVKGQQ